MTDIKQAYEDEQLIGLVPPDMVLYLVKSHWLDMIVSAQSPTQAKGFLHGYVGYLSEAGLIPGDYTYQTPDDIPDSHCNISELQPSTRPTILHSNWKFNRFPGKEDPNE